jgi:hypothetical protein
MLTGATIVFFFEALYRCALAIGFYAGVFHLLSSLPLRQRNVFTPDTVWTPPLKRPTRCSRGKPKLEMEPDA